MKVKTYQYYILTLVTVVSGEVTFILTVVSMEVRAMAWSGGLPSMLIVLLGSCFTGLTLTSHTDQPVGSCVKPVDS